MSKELSEANCYVALTHDHLNAQVMMDKVRSPKAGAIVLFAGTHSLLRDGEPDSFFSQVQREITSVGSLSKNYNIHLMSHVPYRACSVSAKTFFRNTPSHLSP
jgi:hypothetical protein